MIFFLNRVKTVPLSCSLHGHRVRMRTCFFSRRFIGTAIQLLQSFTLHLSLDDLLTNERALGRDSDLTDLKQNSNAAKPEK